MTKTRPSTQSIRELSQDGQSDSKPEPLLKLLKQKSILIFSISAILFHLANAAQLPLLRLLLFLT